MPKRPSPSEKPRRQRLNRARVVAAAVALADQDGRDSLTMRNLALDLDVVPMAIYKHVSSKEELFSLMVDEVFAEIEMDAGLAWKDALRDRAISLRAALLRHPWAIGLTEAVSMGPSHLRDHESVLRCLREDMGLPFSVALHVLSALDGLVYGFTLQQKSLLADSQGDTVMQAPPTDGEYPYVTELVEQLSKTGYDYDEEFRFGLELLLDSVTGLQPAKTRSSSAGSRRPQRATRAKATSAGR